MIESLLVASLCGAIVTAPSLAAVSLAWLPGLANNPQLFGASETPIALDERKLLGYVQYMAHGQCTRSW